MPITACFACTTFVALILLIPIVPISLVLFGSGRRRSAVKLVGVPVAMLGLPTLFTISVLVLVRLCGGPTSWDSDYLFEDTFGFWAPVGTEVLEAYCERAMDREHRAMKFRAPPAIIEKICAKTFTSTNRETFVAAYGSNWRNWPEQVRSWFLPSIEQADQFYIAEPFNRTLNTWNRAILCYSEETGVACFCLVDIYGD